MGTVVAAWTKSFVNYLARRGVEAAPLLARAGIDQHDIDRDEGRIDAAKDTELWRAALDVTGDEHLGLQFSREGVDDGTFGVVGMLARASEDAEAAMRAGVTFHRLIKDDAHASFAIENGAGVLRWDPALRQGAWLPAIEDDIVANCVHLGRRWTGVDFAPISISMRRGKPSDVAPYEENFGCPIHFGSDRTEIVFPADVLRLELCGRSPDLVPYLALAAGTLMHSLTSARTLEDEVMSAIAEVGTELRAVAAHLGVSARTLQRQLAQRGKRYQALVDEHRRRTALALMQSDRPLRASDIARLSGFADTASFRRALRRWLVRDAV